MEHLSKLDEDNLCELERNLYISAIAVYSVGKGRRPSIPPTSLTFASLLLIPFKEKLIAKLILRLLPNASQKGG